MIKKIYIAIILLCLLVFTIYSEEQILKMWRADPQRTGVYQTKALTELHGIKWEINKENVRFKSDKWRLTYIFENIVSGSTTDLNFIFDKISGQEYDWKSFKYDISDYVIILNNIGIMKANYRWNIISREKIKNEYSPDNVDILYFNNILYYLSYEEDPYILTIYTDDFMTGKKLWEREERADTIFMFPTSIAAKDTVLIVPYYDTVFAYDTKTGKELWKRKLPRFIGGGAVIGKDTVYVEAKGIYGLQLTTGKILWHNAVVKPADDVIGFNTLALYNNVVIASDRDKLYGIQVKTGKIAWEYTFPDGSSEMTSTVIAENVCYIGHGNTMYAINGDNGTLLWKFETKHYIHFTPLIEDGVLYFGNDGGEFYALH